MSEEQPESQRGRRVVRGGHGSGRAEKQKPGRGNLIDQREDFGF